MKTKIILLYIGILMIGLGLGISTYAATTILPGSNTGLRGYWSFNEGIGTLAHDFSGNLNTGTLISSPTWTLGKFGMALNFNGTNYITTTYTEQLTDFTVCAWFNDPATTNAYERIVDKSYTNGFWLGRENGVANSWGGGVEEGTSPFGRYITLSDGVWHQICSRRSGTTHTIIGDGGKVSISGTVSSSPIDASSLYIGRAIDGSASFGGKIDDVRVYNRALSDSEILSLYRTSSLTTKLAPQSGSVAYWPLDENSSTMAHDFLQYKNNGTLVGSGGSGIATWVAGKRARALHFDGVDDEIDVPQTSSINLSNNGSISVWVKPETSNDADVFQSGSGVANAMTIWMAASQGNQIWFGRQQGDATDWAQSTTEFVPGQWIHIVGVMNNNVETIYINGVAEGSSSNTGSFSNGATYLIGSGDDGHFQGVIDDMRIYNRPLTAAEAMNIYRLGQVQINASQNNKSKDGLVGLFSFNGTDISGTTALDQSGNAHNGTLQNNPQKVIGKLGQALQFNNSSTYIDGIALGSVGNSDWTESAWVKTTSNSAGVILTNRITSGDRSISLHVGWAGGSALNNGNAYVSSDGPACEVGAQGTTNIADGKWHHVAGVRRNISTYEIYVDGSLQATNNLSLGSGPCDNAVSSSNWMIGQGPQWANVMFNGSLDEIRAYNRALSASEIKQLYLMGN